MIMQHVLRWKYRWTTLGHKTIQQHFPQKILMFWKTIIIYQYEAKLCCFLLVFSFGQFGIKKIILKLSHLWEMAAMEVTQGGSNTHNAPHKMGAAWTAARPLLVQKNSVVFTTLEENHK